MFIRGIAGCCEPCGSGSQPVGVRMIATWCRLFCRFRLCLQDTRDGQRGSTSQLQTLTAAIVRNAIAAVSPASDQAAVKKALLASF